MLPNFLVIGSPKAATTWIYEVLKEHPEVYVNPKVKDIFFFNRFYNKGLSWYKKYFRNLKDEKVIGDITESYFRSSEAPERIKNNLGDIKLLCVFRDPIEAAFSYYLQNYRDGKCSKDFFKAIKQKPEIVDSYLYSKHLKRYYKYFDKNLIKVLYFENLLDNSFQFYKELCDFLGISCDFKPNILNGIQNERKYPRNIILSKIKYKIWNFLRYNNFHNLLDLLRKLKLNKLIYTKQKQEIFNLSSNIKEYLINYYRQDLDELRNLLDKDFSHWLEK
jgi:hypothetical protein